MGAAGETANGCWSNYFLRGLSKSDPTGVRPPDAAATSTTTATTSPPTAGWSPRMH